MGDRGYPSRARACEDKENQKNRLLNPLLTANCYIPLPAILWPTMLWFWVGGGMSPLTWVTGVKRVTPVTGDTPTIHVTPDTHVRGWGGEEAGL